MRYAGVVTSHGAAAQPLRPLEREAELGRVDAVLAEVAGSTGQLLVIEGYSGIGKTRLMQAARIAADDLGFDVFDACGGELEREYAFGVVLRLFEARFARIDADERSNWMRGRAALAEPLLGESHALGPRAVASDEFQLLHGLYWLLVNLSERQPVALFVDDLQWVDDLSLRFLVYLTERLADLPVAVIVAVRTGEPAAETDLVNHLITLAGLPALRPAELSVDGVRSVFMAAGIAAASDESFIRSAKEATGGNPLLVHELVTDMGDSTADSGDAEAPGRELPQSLRRRVLLRVRRLGIAELEVARACAVLGDEATLALVSELAGVEGAVAMQAAERLSAAHVLTKTDPAAFAHPIVRSAIYEGMPPGTRPRAHAQAARLLDARGGSAERIAHHLLIAAPVQKEWAGLALQRGARAASRRGAPTTAARFLRHALQATVVAPAHRAEMLIDLGFAEAASGDTTSLARFEDALDMIAEPVESARALSALGLTLYRYGHHTQASRSFQRGAKLFRGRDDELALRFEGAALCAVYYEPSEQAMVTERMLALTDNGTKRRASCQADHLVLGLLAAYRALTLPAPASSDLAIEALRDDVLLRGRGADGMALHIAICALWLSGQAAEAEAVAGDALVRARDRGNVLAFAEASMVRGLIGYSRGRLLDAAADSQAAIDGMGAGWRQTGSAPRAVFALCLIEQGELDQADRLLAAAEPELMESQGFVNVWFHLARGRLRLIGGAHQEALELFVAAGDILAPFGIVNPLMAPWRSGAGLAAAALGDRERALALIGEEVSIAARAGLQISLGVALRARGLVQDDPSVAQASLQASVTALEGQDAPLELAKTLADLGSLQRRQGQRRAARKPLRRALDLASRCPATALEQHVLAELAAAGARPRSTMISGAFRAYPE